VLSPIWYRNVTEGENGGFVTATLCLQAVLKKSPTKPDLNLVKICPFFVP
jgi:hypothetical protein